jgi:hypothetical protein
VIIYPKTPDQANVLASFLHKHAHVAVSTDMKCMAWVETAGKDAQLCLVVGFNAFMGSVCQMHVAMAPGYHFTPQEMLRATFDHAFNSFKVKKLIGIVNSKNEKAMKYDQHLGFVEEHRMPGLHDDGGDIVILSMTREQCKYLEKKAAA